MEAHRVAVILLLLPLTFAAAATVPEAAALHGEIQRLDQVVQQLLVRAARNAESGHALPHLADDAEELAASLDHLEAEVVRLGDEALRDKVRRLRAVAGNLQRAVDQPESAAPAWASRRPEALDLQGSSLTGGASAAPSNDACAAAPIVGFGTWVGTTTDATRDGEAGCGSSLLSPDVWYRYTSASGGYVYLDTFGSSYDTVVSVHTDCPGTLGGQLTCNDDAYGLQSAAGFFASAGQTYSIRVSGVNGATGNYQFHIGTAGSIEGEVRDATDNAPLQCMVQLYDKRMGHFIRYVESSPADGTYSMTGLDPESYFLVVDYCAGYQSEVYDGLHCGGSCDATSGTPVVVSTSGVTSGIDFTLDRAGAIEGTVTETGSGIGVGNIRMEVFAENGNRYDFDFTDGTGHYTFHTLPAGNYYVQALDGAYRSQVYDGIPCSGSCVPLNGTPIPVSLGAPVTGIDFVLQKLGAISGVVTNSVTGDPVYDARVRIYNPSGYVTGGWSQTDGTYDVVGLENGTYFAVASEYDHPAELYDEIDCPGWRYSDCVPNTGIPIVVNGTIPITGVNFTLDVFGSIAGAVTSQGTGTPVSTAYLRLYTSDGNYSSGGYTDNSGTYWFHGVRDDDYFVAAEQQVTNSNLVAEVYDDAPCYDGTITSCQPTNGTPVATAVNTEVTANIALNVGGRISGTVSEAVTGAPIEGATVILWNSNGELLRSALTAAAGQYEAIRVTGSEVFAEVHHPDFINEVYVDIVCPDNGCDPLTGTGISITPGMLVTGVDFELTRLGRIAGTVTHSTTGNPIENIYVNIYDDMGKYIDSSYTDAGGSYEVAGLEPGTYYARTSDYDDYYLHEAFGDHPCWNGCYPTDSTPIGVTLRNTSVADFSLDRYALVSGMIFDAGTGSLVNGDVYVFDTAGNYVDYFYDYNYRPLRLFSGTYYLMAKRWSGYSPEVYQEVPCSSSGCVPTLGTPLTVALNEEVSGIDFTLSPNGMIKGFVTDNNGLPLQGAATSAYDALGRLVDFNYTSANGQFVLYDLPVGEYFVTAGRDGYVRELFSNIPCLFCDVTKGQPVAVKPGQSTRHVNFALAAVDALPQFSRGIRGRVTDGGGQPLAGVVIDVWYPGGSYYNSVITAPDGTYSVEPHGATWYLSTDNGQGLVNQLYDGIRCPGPAFAGLCDPTTGTPVVLPTSDSLVENVDFVLSIPAGIFTDGFESGDTCAWSSGCP